MSIRRSPYINSSHNRQFFDTSSLSITFNEEYCQYPNINSIAHIGETRLVQQPFSPFSFFFHLRFVCLILHFSLQKGSGGADYVNLMESVRHELEYSSFFLSIFHTCIHVYSKKSPPDFKRNQRTNGPVKAHLSLLHIPINMFEYYGI